MMTRYFSTVQVQPGLSGVLAAISAVHELFEDGQSVALIAADSAVAQAAIAADSPLHCDEPTLILTTSGSTGGPRGVEIPLSALAQSAEASALYFGNQAVWLTAIPVTGMGGLNTVIRSALAGTEPVIWDGIGGAGTFDAATFIPYLEATVIGARKQNLAAAASLVPTQLHRIVNNDQALAALARLDYVLVGGGATSQELLDQCALAGVRIVRTYGSTETSGGCVYNGEPLEGVQLHFDDASVVTVNGPTLAHSYRDGQPIAANGWRSSDRGRISDGTLEIFGRIDDIVKVAGHNVDLQLLTLGLRSHPDIDMIEIVGRPDRQYENIPVIAFTGSLPESVVETMAREVLIENSIPLRVVRLAEIPLLPNGKPDRIAIQEL